MRRVGHPQEQTFVASSAHDPMRGWAHEGCRLEAGATKKPQGQQKPRRDAALKGGGTLKAKPRALVVQGPTLQMRRVGHPQGQTFVAGSAHDPMRGWAHEGCRLEAGATKKPQGQQKPRRDAALKGGATLKAKPAHSWFRVPPFKCEGWGTRKSKPLSLAARTNPMRGWAHECCRLEAGATKKPQGQQKPRRDAALKGGATLKAKPVHSWFRR
jgi:hypothetical protein